MNRYTQIVGIIAVALIFGFAAYGGYTSDQNRIECKKHMATTTQRSAEDIVRICQ